MKSTYLDYGMLNSSELSILTTLSLKIHTQNHKAGWWNDRFTGLPIDRNIGELLCLVHSEVSEAMEGFRKDIMDDKLPHRKMAEVELADAVIRIFDICGAAQFDLGSAVYEKMQYNLHRADHKPENRIKDGGKAF